MRNEGQREIFSHTLVPIKLKRVQRDTASIMLFIVGLISRLAKKVYMLGHLKMKTLNMSTPDLSNKGDAEGVPR